MATLKAREQGYEYISARPGAAQALAAQGYERFRAPLRAPRVDPRTGGTYAGQVRYLCVFRRLRATPTTQA